MMMDLVIAGTGGFAREVFWLVEEINAVKPALRVLGFSGPNDPGDLPAPWLGSDYDVRIKLEQEFGFVVAVGNGKLRQDIFKVFDVMGIEPVTLVHPSARIAASCRLGRGSIVCAGVMMTVNISVGDGFLANLNCTVGHDCAFGDFVTLHPGCNVSGNAKLGILVELGSGTVVLPGMQVGNQTQVGAGAVVTENLPANVVAVGIPAKVIKEK